MSKLARKCGECDFAPYIAELVATFIFVFIGAGSIISGALDSFSIAVAHGLTIALMVAAIGNISGGHINPAVTWAMIVRGLYKGTIRIFQGSSYRWEAEFGFVKGLGYITAQLAGAVAGASILLGLAYLMDSGKAAADAVNLGTPGLKEGLDPTGGLIWEVFFAFLLVFVVLRTSVEQKLALAPFAIGGAVFAGALAGYAFNPARWFGPALISGTWDNAWIYTLAPIIGSVSAVIVNDLISSSKKSSRSA